MCNSNIGKGSWIKDIIGNSSQLQCSSAVRWITHCETMIGICALGVQPAWESQWHWGSYSCSNQEFLLPARHGRAEGWVGAAPSPPSPSCWVGAEFKGEIARSVVGSGRGSAVPRLCGNSWPQAVQNECLSWDIPLLAGRGRSWPVVCLWTVLSFCAWTETGKREDAQAAVYKNLLGCLHGKDRIYPSP